MSAWPEAVWIVRKMKKFFNLDARVTTCANKITNLNSTIVDAKEQVDNFAERLEQLGDLALLELTLAGFRNQIENNTRVLNEIQNIVNGMSQTPAIFDTDEDDLPDVPDREKDTEFTSSSIWFVES